MLQDLADQDVLPGELRELVKRSVALLGEVIAREAGVKLYAEIERLRRKMTELRAVASVSASDDEATRRILRAELETLARLSARDRLTIAHAFTAMLELMNACENAYRGHRLALHSREAHLAKPGSKEAAKLNPALKPDAIIYVLTAHPTEARAPKSIQLFHAVQRTLRRALSGAQSWTTTEKNLRHELELVWRVSLARERAPKVSDEAEHIYSLLLDRPILQSLLAVSAETAPVFVRTWVGGDKDGHPGVDEKVTTESLSLARSHLVRFVETSLNEVHDTLKLLPGAALATELAAAKRALTGVRALKAGDGARVTALRKAIARLALSYEKKLGALHPILTELKGLLCHFPALVVPLELRESSDVLMADPKPGRKLAIDRMLRVLASFAKGGDPRWYARGFIVSMTGCLEHLQVAESKSRAAFGRPALPIIPLFEQTQALEDSPRIVGELLADGRFGRAVKKDWNGVLEVMVGYSDSSKEAGVLPSRLAIARGMRRVDEACNAGGVSPLFFQGSGGSIDRGGGSIGDQVAWWPRSALKNYKVTVQGEMVERSFSSPEITAGQIETIARSVGAALGQEPAQNENASLAAFAARVSREYRAMIANEDFLKLVARATPYADLAELKMGSRPTSRTSDSGEVSVKGLRAIPWVLCWTQTRVLFQTWWGVGTAWREADVAERAELKKAFAQEPVFASYVRALGFTLGKVELAVWRVYLDRSGLPPELTDKFYARFQAEVQGAREMLVFITGHRDPLWFRPWLGASIRLRAPMIHPLNLLQITAMETKDFRLLRNTVTGIASGMMTTG